MAEKEKQHIVPVTFLKQFEIQGYKFPNHVWSIDFKDEYQKEPVVKGIKAKLFWIKNFYSLNDSEDKLILENFYSDKLEPEYTKILKEINNEINLSKQIRLRLIEWILHSNQRTEYYRKNIQKISKWLIEMDMRFENHKKNIDIENELKIHSKTIENTSKEIAKEIQIADILNIDNYKKHIMLFVNELQLKKWVIYKSPENYPFIANDNPGFSLNISHLNKEKIFNPTIHLNHLSFNYLILSPKYCLYIEPFKQNDSAYLNAFNIEIEYKEISREQIDFINLGTCLTSMRYIVSNNLETIKKWNIIE